MQAHNRNRRSAELQYSSLYVRSTAMVGMGLAGCKVRRLDSRESIVSMSSLPDTGCGMGYFDCE